MDAHIQAVVVREIEDADDFIGDENLMKLAKRGAIFMNCLPAKRGHEQTAEVIDGNQSVVFDQAENRLHIQKAILLYILEKEI